MIKTERLHLRPLTKDDSIHFYNLRSNNDVNKYLNRNPHSSLEETERLIEKIDKEMQVRESLFLVISLKENSELIGTICLWNFNEEKTIAEIGYELHPEFQGKGIIHEAIQPVIKLGFDHFRLKMISGWTNSQNIKSINVLERNGFERNIKEEEKISETYPEMVIYSLHHSRYES